MNLLFTLQLNYQISVLQIASKITKFPGTIQCLMCFQTTISYIGIREVYPLRFFLVQLCGSRVHTVGLIKENALRNIGVKIVVCPSFCFIR